MATEVNNNTLATVTIRYRKQSQEVIAAELESVTLAFEWFREFCRLVQGGTASLARVARGWEIEWWGRYEGNQANCSWRCRVTREALEYAVCGATGMGALAARGWERSMLEGLRETGCDDG